MKTTKKSALITLFALIAALFAPFVPSFAAAGDAAGEYFYTDIKTYINHSPITCYSIGGGVFIDAESLVDYGFGVCWRAETRTLEIISHDGKAEPIKAMGGELPESGGAPGSAAGVYRETDITVTLDGSTVESYNIGGGMFVSADVFDGFGYAVTWDGGARTLTVFKQAEFNVTATDQTAIATDYIAIATDYGEIRSLDNHTEGPAFFDQCHRGVILETVAGDVFEFPLLSGHVLLRHDGVSFVRLADICDAINAECALIETLTERAGGHFYGGDYEYTLDLSFKKNGHYALFVADAVQTEYETTVVQPDASCYGVGSVKLCVNGEDIPVTGCFEGHEYAEEILVVDGVIYIPTYMTAKILALYSFAY